jgi:rhodanese-related sulfurtransferase/DNA-binding XRE family transcriptional regulator
MIVITPAQLQSLLSEGKYDLIDVREPAEWATGHVPGARLVPLAQVRADPQSSAPSDNVVFICAKGGRSATAAGLAEEAGRRNVYSVAGGTEAWIAENLPVTVPRKNAAASAKPGATEAEAVGAAQDVLVPELEAVVGANLKSQRTQRGLSLDDLAREAGVSRTLLGQIEIGKASPTVRVIHSREDAEPHRPGTRENLVVTSGRLELRIGSERVVLTAGDAVDFAADIPHAYINPASEECWAYLVMNYEEA